ncbi:hypothetical protein MVEN_01621900 [Mycena venus]|uniref:Uncharacterized protein n=1 Tax=Mycena venus TaxID=2733690 RepID=A0A8H6XQ86_9AGAR|nr:hypothetical protein MVEN_01621900 [Mycena venus]
MLQILACCLGTDIGLIQTCWAAFKDVVWNHPDVTATDEEITTYNNAALSRDTFRVCINPEYENHRDSDNIMTLDHPLTYKATLFTARNGALPVYISSLYCRRE